MINIDEKLENLQVIKRNKKKVFFTGEKIANAIRKGFESVHNEDYNSEDVNKVYNEVVNTIYENYKKSITIEEIQDIVEEVLVKLNYEDIKDSYSAYRERRNESRKIFSSKQHKLMKAIEELSLKDAEEEDSKRENGNIDGNSSMGTMLQFGSTLSKEFAKSYLMDNKFATAHDDGSIHIHDMDFMPMGTTTCLQIDLNQLFKEGFSTGHGFLRSPNDIMSYSALAAIAIQANQNDQHGGQSIPAFDYFLAPGVLKTFKREFKQHIYDFLDIEEFLDFVNFDKIENEIVKLTSIDVDLTIFDKYIKNNNKLRKIIEKAYNKALQKTERKTYQAMEAFIHNLNTMHSRAGAQVPFSSINFGTDTTSEGRMITKNYLLALEKGLGKGETPIFPISIFKVKEGLNYDKKDKNYDLFELSCKVSAKRLFPNFSFIDSSFNKGSYVEGDYKTEVAYMGCRTRVFGNVAAPDKEIITSRGNLSFSTINLPRIAIKHSPLLNEAGSIESFFNELDELMELVKKQLLQRYEIQGNKKVKNFPFLMGQGLWLDSKNLKPNDKLKRVLKHGTLSIGFIGLAEALTALIGKHHGESKEAQELGIKIIEHMRNKCDEYASDYKLNFTLLATPAEGLSGRFTNIDKSIYGIIKGVTDKDYYTNSFHVPVAYNTSVKHKIEVEAPYHKFTNAGHISYIELDGDAANNVEAFMKIVRIMKENDMGYAAINHPVDRDPVCGFNGIIGDVCPGCNRTEADGIKFERIRRITGYLVGSLDRFNNGKKAEEQERVKHSINIDNK